MSPSKNTELEFLCENYSELYSNTTPHFDKYISASERFEIGLNPKNVHYNKLRKLPLQDYLIRENLPLIEQSYNSRILETFNAHVIGCSIIDQFLNALGFKKYKICTIEKPEEQPYKYNAEKYLKTLKISKEQLKQNFTFMNWKKENDILIQTFSQKYDEVTIRLKGKSETVEFLPDQILIDHNYTNDKKTEIFDLIF